MSARKETTKETDLFLPGLKEVGTSGRVLWAVAMGVLAAWLAAGSVGLLASPLRITLTWVLLVLVAVLTGFPGKRQLFLLVGVGAGLSLPLFFPTGPVQETLLVALVLAALASGQKSPTQQVLWITACAALALGLFRLAGETIPLIWLLSDALGYLMGRGASALTGRPLDIGATFAGLDFLVTSLVLVAGLKHARAVATWKWTLWPVLAILAVHLLYLVLLSFAAALGNRLPIPATPEYIHPYVPPPWSWAREVRQLVPWNLPALAAVLHLGVILILFRWASCRAEGGAPAGQVKEESIQPLSGWKVLAFSLGPFLLALFLPVSATWTDGRCDLSGKKIVANQQGLLDWRRPKPDAYGRQSAGGFGMLPVLVESLGGRLTLSTEFSNEDLKGADLVIWLQPAGPVSQPQCDRIWDFVRRGGALLVVAAPFSGEGPVNDILDPTAMVVRGEVALSPTGSWQQGCQPLAHPATAILRGKRQPFFTDAGTSLAINAPARPLVVGRWGWSEPGSEAELTGGFRWEVGEKLGDLVLAAEQPWEKGTIAVIGDGFSLTNEGSVRGYEWTGRLLSYLVNRPANPQNPGRQLVSLLMVAGLFLGIYWLAVPPCLVWSTLVLSVSLGICGRYSLDAGRVVPDGRLIETKAEAKPYGLAYIDGSHLEAYSDRHWGFEALNGLALNLMRNGFLVATLPEITPERLEGANLVVSIAPARSFSPPERGFLHEFVNRGGILISMVGAEQAPASECLLQDFGLHVPASPVPTLGQGREPEPMGKFRSLFLNAKDFGAGDYKVGVLFFTGWPVEKKKGTGSPTLSPDVQETEFLVYGPNDTPVVVLRKVGQGGIVLIGDSNFALNKNLEYIGGEPFEGRYENAHFWRWLLTRLLDGREWIPPQPPPLAPEAKLGQEKPK